MLQVLAQEIGVFGLRKRLDTGDRNVETYDYEQARQFYKQKNCHFSEDEDSHGEEEEEEEDEEMKNKR